MKEEEIKKSVREGYAKIAKKGKACCNPVTPCCGTDKAEEISRRMGYGDEELAAVPEGANLGLGCGNPVALASIRKGETVLDLGSGAGFDCFLAANKVGKEGKVIGVDMTPEMVEKARHNAKRGGYKNVEFRLGEIENIPAGDNSVDVVISNCVVNLAPDKGKVFREAFRILRPGGRLMVSDIVLLAELPEAVKNSVEAYIGCVSGAIMHDKYLETIRDAGFRDVRIVDETHYPVESLASGPAAKELIENSGIPTETIRNIGESVSSIKVQGTK